HKAEISEKDLNSLKMENNPQPTTSQTTPTPAPDKYLQSSSNIHSIISIIICSLSLAIGVFLYIAEKKGMMSVVRSIISTSVFGTGSFTTLLGSLFALKNLLNKSRIDTLDELFAKEDKVSRRKMNWTIKNRINHFKTNHFKMNVNYENEFISEFIEETKNTFKQMNDMYASNYMIKIANCYKIRDIKFINELLNELLKFVKKNDGQMEDTNANEEEVNIENDKKIGDISLVKVAREYKNRNACKENVSEHVIEIANEYKSENKRLVNELKSIVLEYAKQAGNMEASKEIANIADELQNIKQIDASKNKVMKLINIFLNFEEEIAIEQIRDMNTSEKLGKVVTEYKNEDMELMDILLVFVIYNLVMFTNDKRKSRTRDNKKKENANKDRIMEKDIKENTSIRNEKDKSYKKEENANEDEIIEEDINIEKDDKIYKKEENANEDEIIEEDINIEKDDKIYKKEENANEDEIIEEGDTKENTNIEKEEKKIDEIDKIYKKLAYILGAFDENYDIVFIKDATATDTQEMHEATLLNIGYGYGIVTTVKNTIEWLSR
ncbi:25661_t:CDS:2, partial [Gigaspora margarita]